MTHLFISPHFDDAVLSCGGLIHRLVQQGELVRIFTVMAGAIPPDLPRTPFVEEHILRWALGPDPVSGRRDEDARAARLLGAGLEFGPFPDALFRTDGRGHPLYPDRAALFGDPNPHDHVPAQFGALALPMEAADVVYAPLGAGQHVDHVIVRNAVAAWAASRPQVAIFFYEEYPYSAKGADVIEAARAALGRPLVPDVRMLDETEVAARIAAVACHRSQTSSFWANDSVMAQAVRQYAASVGEGTYAERLWKPA